MFPMQKLLKCTVTQHKVLPLQIWHHVANRSPSNLCPNLSNTNAVASTGDEIIVTEEVGSFNMFQDPTHFLAFLAEVIQQTIVA